MELYGMQDNDAVISGVSLAFPGVRNFSELMGKLVSSTSPIKPEATEKLPVGYLGELPEHGRLLDSKPTLDHIFFGLSKQVATSVEYLTRKLLEKTFEALMDAGMNPIDAQDVICDVYQNTLIGDGEMAPLAVGIKETYAITGRNRAMTANRVSFFLNAKGCSASRDCGYLGGMLGLQMAVNEVRSGRADMAVVCGGNVASDPATTQQYNDLGWLCMDGKTRVFDNEASGFVNSEGVAALVVQRAKDAKRIYARIRHVSLSSGLKTNSFCKQTQENWEKTLNEFYTSSQIPVNDICYLEAYGSGLKEMDAAELNAVTNVLCKNRDRPLLIGSVKSNVGHIEAGADFASIIKAIICFETGKIPRNEDYSSPNRRVPGLIKGKLKVVEQVTPLPENGLIGISGWAFGGVYGHLVLEGFSKPKQPVTLSIPRLVALSARTDDFTPRLISQLEGTPFDPEYLHLVTDVFKRKIDRFLGRGYVLLPKKENSVSHYEKSDDTKRPLWFVFSGMGSQWQAMGKYLMRLPVIRESIERSHRTLQTIANIDLIHIITTEDPAIFDNILHSFVGIAAIQIALVDMLKLLKISPDGIVGHSVGELGCAYMDGCLTAEQMISAAYYRGKASLDATLERGFMAAVGKGYGEIKDELPDGVEVACHNSSTSCTLSGRAEAVSEYVEELKGRGIFARTVNVANIAYHSTYIKPAAPFLLNYLKKVIPNPLPRSSKWVSSSVPEAEWGSERSVWCSAEYHTNNLLGSVLFEEASRHIPENAVVVEVAPHGLLQAILKRSLGPGVINIPLTNRMAKDPLAHLLEAIGKIYIAGFELDVNALYPKVEYPVSRGTGQIQQLLHWVPDGFPKDYQSPPQKLKMDIRAKLLECDPSMFGFGVAGNRLFPVSVYIHLIEEQLGQYLSCPGKKLPLVCTDFRLPAVTALSVEHDQWVECSILRGNNHFEIAAIDGTLIASGCVTALEGDMPGDVSTVNNGESVSIVMQKDEIYALLRKHGYIFPPGLQSLKTLGITARGLRGTISGTCSPSDRIEALLQVVLFDVHNQGGERVFPYSIRELKMHPMQDSNADMDVSYDRPSGVVRCPGLSISGVKFKEINSEGTSLSFHSINTVPFSNPPVRSSQQFVQFCCSLIASSEESRDHVQVLEINDHLPSLIPEIETSLPGSKVEIKEDDVRAVEASAFDLVVCGTRQLAQVAASAEGFILIRGHSPIDVPGAFVQISAFTPPKALQFRLLRKKIGLNGGSDFIMIPESMAELLMLLRSRKSKSVLVVGFKEPAEGISHFQEVIQSLVDISIKWLFILDKNAPEFSLTNPLYQQQLLKGMSVNVLKGGEWHFVYKTQLLRTSSSTPENTIEVCDSDQEEEGDRVMGVLSGSSSSDYDPILTWSVPAEWKLEESASVPVPYSLAYHCLKVIGKLRPYHRVLVTDGMSVEGQAAVSVALSLSDRVFVTVGTAEEADQLKSLFPKIIANDVLLHTDKHFGLRLKLAAGQSNPEVIYNFLDNDRFTTCFENVGQWGRIFHFGRDDISRNKIIGLAPFMRGVSLYAVTPDQINKWPVEEKQAVHDWVEEGITTGVVRPLSQAKLTGGETARKSFNKGHKLQRLASKWQRGNQFVINSSGTYAVVGEGSDVDLDIAEWLARRGAKNILICNPALMSNLQYQRKAKSLMLRRSVTVHTYDEQGLKKAMKDTPIDAIFFVNLVDEQLSTALSLVDEIMSIEPQYLVTISRNREYILKMHTTPGSGASCTNILWQADSELLGQNMDYIAPFIGDHSEIAVTDGLAQRLRQRATHLLRESVPESVAGYIRLGKSLVRTVTFVELPTAGLRSENKMEVSPVFFFPGVENDPVELVAPLVRHFPYPAFVATVPHVGMMTISNIAAAFVPKIMSIQSHKTFNIVGLSAGCALAIELTRQLESLGASVALLLVDNPTVPLQQGLPSVEHFQSAFLDILGSKTDKVDELQLQHSTLPWSTRMNHVVSCLDLPPSADCWVVEAVKYISDIFSAVLNYQLDSVEIKGPLTILRSSESEDPFNYNKLCVNNETVDSELTRSSLLRSTELKALMEKFMITNDMSVKVIHHCVWPEFEELLHYRQVIDRM